MSGVPSWGSFYTQPYVPATHNAAGLLCDISVTCSSVTCYSGVRLPELCSS